MVKGENVATIIACVYFCISVIALRYRLTLQFLLEFLELVVSCLVLNRGYKAATRCKLMAIRSEFMANGCGLMANRRASAQVHLKPL